MKNNNDFRNASQEVMVSELTEGNSQITTSTVAFKRFKRIILIGSIASLGFSLNSCTTGYVATEPTYIENTRPARPSNVHIWVDGNWVYSRQTRAYTRHDGYWQRPNHGRTYVSGHWQSSPRGQYWVQGRWQNHRR